MFVYMWLNSAMSNTLQHRYVSVPGSPCINIVCIINNKRRPTLKCLLSYTAVYPHHITMLRVAMLHWCTEEILNQTKRQASLIYFVSYFILTQQKLRMNYALPTRHSMQSIS